MEGAGLRASPAGLEASRSATVTMYLQAVSNTMLSQQ